MIERIFYPVIFDEVLHWRRYCKQWISLAAVVAAAIYFDVKQAHVMRVVEFSQGLDKTTLQLPFAIKLNS